MRLLLRADYDSVKVLEEALALSEGEQRFAQAIISLYDDEPMKAVAKVAGVSEAILWDWISAFNRGGMAAVIELGDEGIGRWAATGDELEAMDSQKSSAEVAIATPEVPGDIDPPPLNANGLRSDFSAADLNLAATGAHTAAARKLFLALSTMYDGTPLKETATLSGVPSGWLECWRQEFNRNGLACSEKQPVPGPAHDFEDFANNWSPAGPDFVHWALPPLPGDMPLEVIEFAATFADELPAVRLEAIASVYRGERIEEAAASANVGVEAVFLWIDALRMGALSPFVDSRGRKIAVPRSVLLPTTHEPGPAPRKIDIVPVFPISRFPEPIPHPDRATGRHFRMGDRKGGGKVAEPIDDTVSIRKLRQELAKLKARGVSERSPRFRRLEAVLDYMKAGRQTKYLVRGTRGPVLEWMRRFDREGVTAFGNSGDRHLLRKGVTAKDIRERAARIRNNYRSGQLEAIALFYDGNNVVDIEDEEGLSPGTLAVWIEEFRDRGLAAYPAQSSFLPPEPRPAKTEKSAARSKREDVREQWFTPYPKYDRESLVRILNGTKDDAFAAALGSVILAHDGKSIHEIEKVVGATEMQIIAWVSAYSEDGIIGIAP